MPTLALHEVLRQLDGAALAAGRPAPRLLAVSKTRDAAAVAELARAGQRAFGENYVQEAVAKHAALAEAGDAGPALEWHLIGHLQSNKARQAAALFDWVQTVDRVSLVTALARHRPPGLGALNVLLQVNVDDEAGKHGCRPDELGVLADAVASHRLLRLRGLMVIPAPHADVQRRRPAFRRARELFADLQRCHRELDTLSMGMSDDFAVAIEEGATMVRVGTALFGQRSSKLDP